MNTTEGPSATAVGGSEFSEGLGLAPECDHAACALDYYRAAVEKRAPKWVPARVRLAGPVRGDYPIGHLTMAEADDHDCDSNRWGAVSVRATNGQMLGLKPAEFEVIAWRANTKAW